MSKIRVFLLPDCLMNLDGSQILCLRNPSSNGPSYFILSKASKELFEIQGFDESFRSWFIKENVYTDGVIRIATPYNPVYLILPYLMKSEKNVPLDHLLQDADFPFTALLTEIVTDLSYVADQIGPPDLGVWCYNEELTLIWLTKKIDELVDHLQMTRECTNSSGSFSENEDSYKILAFGILSENLSEKLKDKLKSHLNLDLVDKENVSANGNQFLSKKQKVDSISNGSSVASKKSVVKPSTKEKKLADAAKGSKAITMFFKKKN